VGRPSVQDLSSSLRALAVEIAERLARRGARVWIVGGAVRDLAIGRGVHDVDLASSAPPEVVEQEFLRTIPIGRAFGTVVVHLQGRDVEHTTFRTEDGYADARRPDAVRFGSTPEEDATRRDFRCNALYLDPLTDEVRDPTGGLEDLGRGRIACVGDPRRRFGEDGLRIVRLARFVGQLGMAPEAETLRGARETLDALRGVSRERLRVEFEHLFERGGIVPALACLEQTGALERVLPGLGGAERVGRATALLSELPAPSGVELGFAGLFDPALDAGGSVAAAVERLESLKPSRQTLERVRSAWTIADAVRGAATAARSARVRWMRAPGFALGLELALARARAGGEGTGGLEALRAERAALGEGGLAPAPLLVAADVAARGFAPGPLYGILLEEAETLQLDGRLATRDEALAWLERRLQDGGNERRRT
jgi:hypothetical protein